MDQIHNADMKVIKIKGNRSLRDGVPGHKFGIEWALLPTLPIHNAIEALPPTDKLRKKIPRGRSTWAQEQRGWVVSSRFISLTPDPGLNQWWIIRELPAELGPHQWARNLD
jgi:hypothetical protein